MARRDLTVTITAADLPAVKAELKRLGDENERMVASVRDFMSSLPYSAPENLGFLATAKLSWIANWERES
jgi:hypothetical protein